MIAFGKLGDEVAHFGGEAGDFGLGDELAIDLDSLGEGDEVRRSEKTGFVASVAIDRFEHRARGTFAIGAGDMDEFEFVLRTSREFSEFKGAFESKVRAKFLELKQELDRFFVVHCVRENAADYRELTVTVGREASLNNHSKKFFVRVSREVVRIRIDTLQELDHLLSHRFVHSFN
jgi:hypothetical protein